MGHFSTWFSGRLGRTRLTAGFYDPKAIFQTKQVYDSKYSCRYWTLCNSIPWLSSFFLSPLLWTQPLASELLSFMIYVFNFIAPSFAHNPYPTSFYTFDTWSSKAFIYVFIILYINYSISKSHIIKCQQIYKEQLLVITPTADSFTKNCHLLRHPSQSAMR